MERNKTLDIYRAIGLFCIFLAHAMPPAVIMQIRDFDVPLMVFISGLVAPKSVVSLKKYYIHRSIRLLFPTYLFLLFLFALYYLLFVFGIVPPLENYTNVMLNSFLLLENNSIGFVWVVRVFLLMMLITPLLLKARLDKFPNYVMILIAFICILLFFQNCCFYSSVAIVDAFNVEYVQYTIGYGLVYIVALRYNYSKKIERIVTLLVFCAAALFFSYNYIEQYGFPIEFYKLYKYPPALPYLCYGLSICLTLMMVSKSIPLYVVSNKLLCFVGENTFWLYLWHIPFALNVNDYINYWWIRWLILIVIPLIIYSIQYFFVKRFINNLGIAKYLLG